MSDGWPRFSKKDDFQKKTYKVSEKVSNGNYLNFLN